jgi:hypothetical protein
MSYKLLTTNNQKIEKGAALGYATAGLHFAPEKLSGFNVCPMASKGCAAACLNTSGHGRYQRIQDARIKKTQRFFMDRENFLTELVKEIETFVRRSRKNGLTPTIRLNLTSDIQWETVLVNGKTLFEIFPDVQFYDYTKIARRMLPGAKAQTIPNYHLTFSRSESNGALAEMVASAGGNVAVVFNKVPDSYLRKPVVNGDETDLRFLDGKGVIVGLTPKGRAKKDFSGFVVRF